MVKKQGTVIEKLLVSIEADLSELLEQAKEGTEEVEDELEDMESKGKKAFKGMGAAAVKFSVIQAGIQKGLNAITQTLSKVARATAKFFKGIIKGGMEANIMFENYTTQFTTLLGSAEAAQARIHELTIFAVKTPFELPGIVEASRVLQVFGGDALATGDELTMVGDIAAGVGREFNEVALWIGRMYDSMQSGRPFGIAASRLQVMGAMTGKARAELEKMQKEGASGAEMWERFNELVGDRWRGNMERLSRTLTGIISNIKDFVSNLLRVAGQDFFESIREQAWRLLEILEEARPELEELGKAFFALAKAVTDFIGTGLLDKLEDMEWQDLRDLVDALWEMLEGARLLSDILSDMGAPTLVEQITTIAEKLAEALVTAAKLSALLQADEARARAEREKRAEIRKREGVIALPEYMQTTQQKEEIETAGQEAYNAVIREAVKALGEHEKRIEEHAAAMEKDEDATKGTTDALRDQIDVVEDLTQVTDAERDAVMNFATSLMDLQEATNKRLAKLNEAHLKRMGEIVTKTAEGKHKAEQDAQEKLLKVEQDANRQREKETEDYRTGERRDEEDHQTEMRRLRLQYMMDMADAVRARDARAIVKLRRGFKVESKEREDDHRTRQSREKEDYETRIRELTENENRRKQEIKDSLRQQLTDLEAAQRQALAKEKSSHAERQAELNRAMIERLQTIAKELADEESINEEGARRILETLNKTFGVGGSIDGLMESFAARRRQRMIVRVTFEPEAMTPTVYSPPAQGAPPGYKQPGMGGGWAGSFQHGGAVVAREPTIARFGEVPELATFTPLSQLGGGRGGTQTLDVNLKLSGTAPPGIRSADRDNIAAVIMQALREAGVLRRQG